jgi:hypothetical protein
MKKNLLFLFIILFSFHCLSQIKRISFPESHFGSYKGKLFLKNNIKNSEIDMEFELLPTDTVGRYKYKITYIDKGIKEVRNYRLIEKDKQKGNFIIDEGNGVESYCQLFDSTLYSVFEIENTIGSNKITFMGNIVDFEMLYTSKAEPKKIAENNPEVPPTSSYPVIGIQVAKLLKTL